MTSQSRWQAQEKDCHELFSGASGELTRIAVPVQVCPQGTGGYVLGAGRRVIAWSGQKVGQKGSLRAPCWFRLLEGRRVRMPWAPEIIIFFDNVHWMALDARSISMKSAGKSLMSTLMYRDVPHWKSDMKVPILS